MTTPDPMLESDAARWRWFREEAVVSINEDGDFVVYAYLREATDIEVDAIRGDHRAQRH